MAATFVFDGDCAICTRLARWVEPRLPATVAVRPSEDVDLGALGLSAEDVAQAAWWVDDAARERGHLAIARVWAAMGGPWRVPAWLARTPPTEWVADRSYRLVARNRHRLPGGTPACRLPGGPVDATINPGTPAPANRR